MKITTYWTLASLLLTTALAAQDEKPEFIEEDSAPVDVSDFGQPKRELDDFPERGQIVVPMEEVMGNNMAHWDQWDSAIEAKRWGRYRVFFTYKLERAALGMQLRISDQRFKDQIVRSPKDGVAHTTLGYIYLSEPGKYPMALMTPPIERPGQFIPVSVKLIPAPEHEDGEGPVAGEDGSIVLHAKQAATYATKMRYEPKEVKNCLGFWTEIDDYATWTFPVEKPGKFKVVVSQGCGKGQGGSESVVSIGDAELPFTVEDTGGFQNWKDIEIGELEIAEAGEQVLKIQPKTKAGKAVHDIHKITLVPAG